MRRGQPMYRPAGDEDDDDDTYAGYSFGNEFEEDAGQGDQLEELNDAELVPESQEDCRDNCLYEVIMENDPLNLERMLNDFIGDGLSFTIDTPLKHGFNMLIYACQFGQVDCVNILLKYNANVDFFCSTVTPLMQCCKNTDHIKESFDIVQLLCEANCDVNATDIYGKTAFMFACSSGNINIIRYLLPIVAKEMVDNEGLTALFHAVRSNKVEVVKILINEGLATNMIDVYGYTPLQFCQFNGFVEIQNLLPDKPSYIIPSDYLRLNHHTDLAPIFASSTKRPMYFPDVAALLGAMNSDQFLPLFAESFLGLHDLLNINDQTLKELGIEMPYHRKRILYGLLSFHLRPWAPWSIVPSEKFQANNMKDLYCLLAGHLRHMVVMQASLGFVCRNINEREFGDLNDEMIDRCGEIRKILEKVNDLMKKLKNRIHYLQIFTTPRPPLYIDGSESPIDSDDSFGRAELKPPEPTLFTKFILPGICFIVACYSLKKFF